MEIKFQLFKYLALTCLIIVAVYIDYSMACSCMPMHTQTHYCQADYAILVRVLRKSNRPNHDNKILYKIEIKKYYKSTPTSDMILKHGRLQTYLNDAMCGVDLHVGKLYVIAGRGPILSLCNYIKEYKTMTVVERLGFMRFYKMSCKCHVNTCFGKNCLRSHSSATSCTWSASSRCDQFYSTCLPIRYRTPEGIISKCQWKRTPDYNTCRKDLEIRKFNSTNKLIY